MATLDEQLIEHRSSGGNALLTTLSGTCSSEGQVDIIEVDKDISPSNCLVLADLPTSLDHMPGHIYSLSREMGLTKSIKPSCKLSQLYAAGPLEV
jgi:hypothetical protein